MSYSSEPPTVPGWYYVNAPEEQEPTLVFRWSDGQWDMGNALYSHATFTASGFTYWSRIPSPSELAAMEELFTELRNRLHGEGCEVDADDDPETCTCYHKYVARLDAIRKGER